MKSECFSHYIIVNSIASTVTSYIEELQAWSLVRLGSLVRPSEMIVSQLSKFIRLQHYLRGRYLDKKLDFD